MPSSGANINAYRAVDGVLGDDQFAGWLGTQYSTGEQEKLTLDFGSAKEIVRIRYDNRYGPGYESQFWQESFRIVGSLNGKSWQVLVDKSGLGQGSTQLFEFDIKPATIRYLRVENIRSFYTGITSWHRAYVTEIEAYEKETVSQYVYSYNSDDTIKKITEWGQRLAPSYNTATSAQVSTSSIAKPTSPYNAIDGRPATPDSPPWQGTSTAGISEQLIVDLGSLTEVEKVRYDNRWLLAQGLVWQESFKIMGSVNGLDWFTIANRTGLDQSSPQVFEFDISPRRLRYLRVSNIKANYTNSSNHNAYVSEIEVIKSPAPYLETTREYSFVYDELGKFLKVIQSRIDVQGGFNVALGADVQATSSSGTQIPLLAVDGRYADHIRPRWMGNDMAHGENDSLTVDLGEVKTLDKIRYDNRYDSSYMSTVIWQESFRIVGSLDGTHWETIADMSGLKRGSTKIFEFNFEPRQFRYLRIENIRSNFWYRSDWHYAYAAELEAFEQKTVQTTFEREITPVGVKDFAIAKSLDYFKPEWGLVDTASGYPVEGYNQKTFTQPTAIGFYAQLLANVISGDLATATISRESAVIGLTKLIDSLLTDQQTLGYKGLLPWLNFNGSTRTRASGTYGQQVTLGDNCNLATSLGASLGALMSPGLEDDPAIPNLISKIELFLDRQQQGYTYLYDLEVTKFRRGWNFVSNQWVGGSDAHHDFYGDEFRSGILFVALRYGFDKKAYTELTMNIKYYTTLAGETLNVVSPWDGAAFQILWPILNMPEIHNYGELQDFVKIALDFSARNNLLGFLSACYVERNVYGGNVGIGQIATTTSFRNQRVASLYTLGAARMIDPEAIDAFLAEILAERPDLISNHGLWEGISALGKIISEQLSANVASFILGMVGKGPEQMTRYLQSRNLYSAYQQVYTEGNPLDIVVNNVTVHDLFDFTFDGKAGRAYILRNAPHNMSGRKIKIMYRSTLSSPGSINLEFKQPGGGAPLSTIYNIPFQNTNNQPQELIIDLPFSGIYENIGELVFIFANGTAVRDDIKFINFQII